MELLEAVRLSTKKKPKRDVISWTNVAKLMGTGSPDKWESEYRRKYGDRKTSILIKTPVKDPYGDCLIEMREDGTTLSQRKILMSEADMKDPVFVLKAHGFDPTLFRLVSARNNFWITATKEKGDLNNYQSRIVVEPIKDGEITKEEFKEIALSFKYKHPAVHFVKREGKMALEIDFADLHVGSMSWAKESGEDNDYKITENKIFGIVEQIKVILKLYPISKVFICFLGDFLHVDNEAGTTTAGTSVNVDGRPKKMIQVAYRIAIHIISELSVDMETEVYWIEGNHSRMAEYTLFYSLPMIFSKSSNIKFNISVKTRSAFLYGLNLIGLIHGDMPNKQKGYWLQQEHREAWAIARYVEIHEGHTHQEGKDTNVLGGITIRTNRTPKATDGYEYVNGWIGTPKGVTAYLLEHDAGLKSMHFFD